MQREQDILAGGLVYDAGASEPDDPIKRVHRVASRIGVPATVADDYLKVTGGIESGNRQFNEQGQVLTGPPTTQNPNWRARGMGQVMPDKPGGMHRTINGRAYNLADPEENAEAGLLLFNAGGPDPVGRRLEYFGGRRARKQYEQTGQIPAGGDGYTSYQKYVSQTLGMPQRRRQPKPDILAGGLVDSSTPSVTTDNAALDEMTAVSEKARQAGQPAAPPPETQAGADVTQAAAPPAPPPNLTPENAAWHAAWHLGPLDGRRLTRRVARVLSEAVAEDERKKAAGQEIVRPSVEYQNQMRAKAGLPPLKFNIATVPLTVGNITLNVPYSDKVASPYFQPQAPMGLPDLREPRIQIRPQTERPFKLGMTPAESKLRAEIANQPELYEGEEYQNFLRMNRQPADSENMRRQFVDLKYKQAIEKPGSAENIFVARDVEAARQQRVANMNWPQYLAQAPKSLALGVTDTAATFMKGVAVLNKEMDNLTFGKYKKETTELPAYRVGEAIQREARNVLGSNPDLEQEMLGQSAQTIGQVMTFVFGGWVSKAPKVATVILGSGLTAGDAYDEVRAAGGTDAQAVNAALVAGALLGPTELFGLQGAMRAITDPVKKATWRAALKKALKEGSRDIVENVLQEMGQEWGQGEITGNRRTGKEIGAAALQGAVGGGVTIPLTVVANRPIKEERPFKTFEEMTPEQRAAAGLGDVTINPDETPITLPADGNRQIVHEQPPTILAQIDAMVNRRGNRFGVLIPKGQSAPTQIPKGHVATRTSEGVVIHPKELSADDVRELVDSGNSWQLLGHPNPDTPEATRVVIARSGIEAHGGIQPGTELLSSYVIPGQEQNAIEEMRAQFGPYQPTFEVGGEETAAKTVEERTAGPTGWRPGMPRPRPAAPGAQTAPEEPATPEAPTPSRFASLGNQQLEDYIANTRREMERREAKAAEPFPKGTPKEKREARPGIIQRQRERAHQRITEAQTELDARRAGRDEIPSFEQWLEEGAGGTAGGIRAETLTDTERATFQTQYDQQFYPKPHHSVFQQRRTERGRKGQFAPGKVEVPTAAPETSATEAQQPAAPSTQAPGEALEQAEGQLFATAQKRAVRQPTADEEAAKREPTIQVKPLEKQNALRSYLGNKMTMARAQAFDIIPQSWKDKWNKVVDVFGGSGIHGWQIGKALGKPIHYNELDPDVHGFQQLARTSEGQEELRRVWNPMLDEIARIRQEHPDGGSEAHRKVSEWWNATTRRLKSDNASPAEKAARVLLENSLGTMGGTQSLIGADHKWKKDIGSLGDVSALLDKHRLNAQMWASTSNERAEDFLPKTQPGELVVLDPPYASTKGYAVGNEHGSVNGAVRFINDSIKPAVDRGVSILYTNSAHGPIVEALQDAGLHVRIERIQTQTRSGQTGAYRYEVTAWTPDVSPPRPTNPDVLRGLIQQDTTASQRDLSGQTGEELWNTLITTGQEERATGEAPTTTTRRSPFEQTQRDLEVEQNRLVDECARIVSKKEHFSPKGDPISVDSVLNREIERANNLRLELLRRVENADERAQLEAQYPPWTFETLAQAVQERILAATQQPAQETGPTEPETAYQPMEGDAVEWTGADGRILTGKVLKILPSGAVRVRVSGRTAERKMRLPTDTEFRPHVKTVKETKHVVGRPKLDPTVDSLEKAIRSLGGIKDDGSGELALLKQSGKGGLVVSDGRSAEDLAMALAEMGYGRGVWWEGSQRQGDATFTGVNADEFVQAAIDDASGSQRYYSSAYDQDFSAEEEAYWRAQMDAEAEAQLDASKELIDSALGAELLGEIADGQATNQTHQQLREFANEIGIEPDIIDEQIRIAAESTTARDRAIPNEAESTTEDEGRSLTGEYVDKEGTLRSEAGEPLFKRQQPVIVKPTAQLTIERDGRKQKVEVSLIRGMRGTEEADLNLYYIQNITFTDQETGDTLSIIGAEQLDERQNRGYADPLTAQLRPLKKLQKGMGGDINITPDYSISRTEDGRFELTVKGEKKGTFDDPAEAREKMEENQGIQDLGDDVPLAARGKHSESTAPIQREGTRITINTETRDALERAGIFQPGDGGVTINPARAAVWADRLTEDAKTEPDDAAVWKHIARQIRAATKERNVRTVIIATPEAMRHERFHEASEAGTERRSLRDRHARFAELVEHPSFKKARRYLIATGYPKNNAMLVEETAAHIAEGDAYDIGLTRKQALDFMELWFKSFAERNGNVSLDQFQEMAHEAQKALAAALNQETAEGARRGTDEDVRRLSEGRETRAGPSTPALAAKSSTADIANEPRFLDGRFFSQLYRTLVQKMPAKASVEQVRKIIENPQSGVKTDEVKWSGLDDYLAGKENITRHEVLEFMRANQLQIAEQGGITDIPPHITRLVAELNAAGYRLEVNDEMPDVVSFSDKRFTMNDDEYDMFTSSEMPTHDLRAMAEEIEEAYAQRRQAALIDSVASARAALRGDEVAGHLVEELEGLGMQVRINPGNLEEVQFEDHEGNIYPGSDEVKQSSRNFPQRVRALARRIEDQYFAIYQRSQVRAPTKYERYTVPGESERYREIVFTLPPKPTPALEWRKTTEDLNLTSRGGRSGRHEVWITPDEEYRIVRMLRTTQDRRQYVLDGGPNYNIQNAGFPTLEEAKQYAYDVENGGGHYPVPRSDTFQTDHWSGVINPVAHTRADDRKTTSGERVLFLNEVQSDWHQKGRKQGYKRTHRDGAIDWAIFDFSGNQIGVGVGKTKNEALAEFQGRTPDAPRIGSAEPMSGGGVPQAPFQKNWHEFVMRRMLMDAVENGHDYLGWLTGEQANDLYDLSKHVSKIEIWKDPDEGWYGIKAYPIGKTTADIQEKANTQEKLADYIGKELAERAINELKDDTEGRFKTYSGPDLKVSGAGMIGFYDKIIPDYMRKMVKKWGGKVEQIDIGPRPPKTESEIAREVAQRLDTAPADMLLEMLDEYPNITHHEALNMVEEGMEDAFGDDRQHLRALKREFKALEGEIYDAIHEEKERTPRLDPKLARQTLDHIVETAAEAGHSDLQEAAARVIGELEDALGGEPVAATVEEALEREERFGEPEMAARLRSELATAQAQRKERRLVHAVRITPEMRESLLAEGQPLFKRREKETDQQYEKRTKGALDRLRDFAAQRGQQLRENVAQKSPSSEGEKSAKAPPLRAVPPPKQTSEPEVKERSFPKTAEAMGYRGGNDRDYSVLTDAESLAKAETRITQIGANAAAAEIAQSEESGKVEIATGILLMQRFERAGQVARAVAVAGDLARKLTEAGQTIQAASIITRLSPEGVLLHAQKVMKGKPLPAETAEVIITQARAVSDAERLVAEIQRQRPDIFGPNGEILPRTTTQETQRDGGTRVTTRKGARAKIGKLQDRLARMEADARARMEARKAKDAGVVLSAGGLGSAKIAADLGDLVIIGAAKLARKGITQAVWMAEMAKEATALTKKDLRKLYRESYQTYERERKQFLQESRERGAQRQMAKEGRTATSPAEIQRVINQRLDAMTAARKARAELDRTFRDMQAGRAVKIARTIRDVWGLSRALITSLDLSAGGRQGKMGLVSHPQAWMRGFARQFKALRQSQFERMISEMQADEDYKYAVRFKLELSSVARTESTALGAHEEAYQTELAEKLPWLRMSQNAYDTMLDTLRFGWFKAQLQKYRTAGIDLEDPSNREMLTHDVGLINKATGRGGGARLRKVAPTANMFAFSIRFWASRVEMLALPLNPRMWGIGENAYSPQARKDAWLTLFGFYGLVAAQIGLAALAGAEVNWDPDDEDFIFNPDSPDFLKVKFGPHHVDFSAGLQSHLRVAARLAKSFYKREFREEKPLRAPAEIVEKYLRSKEEPNVALVHDLFFSDKKETENGPRGTDYAGQPVYLTGKPGTGIGGRISSSAIVQRILPIVLQDALDGFKESRKNPIQGGLAMLGSILGEGVTTYSPGYSERKQKWPMQAELEKHGITINPPQRIKPGKYDKFKPETDEEYEARRQKEGEAIRVHLERLGSMGFYQRLGAREQEAAIRATITAARELVRYQQPAAQRKGQAAYTPTP